MLSSPLTRRDLLQSTSCGFGMLAYGHEIVGLYTSREAARAANQPQHVTDSPYEGRWFDRCPFPLSDDRPWMRDGVWDYWIETHEVTA